jgi:hypothetical protein
MATRTKECHCTKKASVGWKVHNGLCVKPQCRSRVVFNLDNDLSTALQSELNNITQGGINIEL